MDWLSWLFWLFILAQFFVPLMRKQALVAKRQAVIRAIERERGSRVVSMIHRQETMSFLGIPISRYIDIEDSEQVLRAIRLTPDDMPIDVILHTPGGLVLAADQIAFALQRHPGKVTVIVPHYAMSGGTLIALAADEIVMGRDAVLGPVDPQLGVQQQGYYPAASILAALEQENPNRSDDTLILGDMARKAIRQVHETVYQLLADDHPHEEADRIATMLSEGRWTHDYPIRFERAREIGLPVNDAVPELVYELMDLYPQTTQRRPSVEFIPVPYRRPEGGPSRRADA